LSHLCGCETTGESFVSILALLTPCTCNENLWKNCIL
jgi:hypothetical protein